MGWVPRARISRRRGVFIQSRDAKPLVRYYPELIEPLKVQLPHRCVLDGEIVIVQPGGLDFEALQLRLHPAASRVELLSKEIPASFVFFDLLSEGDRDLRGTLFSERRAALENLLARVKRPLHVTPATRDRTIAADWFRRFEGAGLDGVIAKEARESDESDKRVMLKVKHARECDCVVAGFRWHKQGQGTAVGSLLLGLYDRSGDLQHVGVCASFTNAKRRELVDFLAPYRATNLDGHPWKDWASAGEVTAGGQRRPGAQAAGARARTCPGSRYVRSSSSKSPTTTCKEGASGIRRNFAAGVPTSSRATARSTSSR